MAAGMWILTDLLKILTPAASRIKEGAKMLSKDGLERLQDQEHAAYRKYTESLGVWYNNQTEENLREMHEAFRKWRSLCNEIEKATSAEQDSL